MTQRDLHNNLDVRPLFNPVASAADNTAWVSAIIDVAGFESLELCPQFGSIPDVDATFTVLVEDSNDSGMSGATAVADTELLGTELLATPLFSDDNTVKKIGYVGIKRYVRMTITPAANTGVTLYGGVAILGHALHGGVGSSVVV